MFKTAQVLAGIAALAIAALLYASTLDRVWNKASGVYERRPSTRTPMPEIRDWDSLRIGLRRTYCEGECPDYSVEIASDGSVTYVGSSFVAIVGEQRASIPPTRVRQLYDMFQRAEFFWLYDQYSDTVTDIPTVTVSIAYDGKSKTVTDHFGDRVGMPSVVTQLQNTIDDAAETGRWTRGQPPKR